MSIAYWCILVTALLPYLWVFIAKRSGDRYNNRNPRAWMAKQEGNYKVQRANAAHLNGFEAFPAFVAGVPRHQRAGAAAPRRLRHEGSEEGIGGQELVDRDGIGVEVQDAPVSHRPPLDGPGRTCAPAITAPAESAQVSEVPFSPGVPGAHAPGKPVSLACR